MCEHKWWFEVMQVIFVLQTGVIKVDNFFSSRILCPAIGFAKITLKASLTNAKKTKRAVYLGLGVSKNMVLPNATSTGWA